MSRRTSGSSERQDSQYLDTPIQDNFSCLSHSVFRTMYRYPLDRWIPRQNEVGERIPIPPCHCGTYTHVTDQGQLKISWTAREQGTRSILGHWVTAWGKKNAEYAPRRRAVLFISIFACSPHPRRALVLQVLYVSLAEDLEAGGLKVRAMSATGFKLVYAGYRWGTW